MSFILNGISSATSYISQKGRSFCRSARDFIYHKALPHDTTAFAATTLFLGAYFLKSSLADPDILNGHPIMDLSYSAVPGAALMGIGVCNLKEIVVNRWKKFCDDRTFERIRDKTQNPKIDQVALCIYCEPGADHNGAFNLSDLPEMQESLETLGSNHELVRRVIRSPVEIPRTYLEVQTEVGSKQIKAVLLFGHGNVHGIKFGTTRRFSLYREITNFPTALTVSDLTSLETIPKDVTLFLMSCSTGKEGGLAEQIAEKCSFAVFASPKTVTSSMKKLRAIGKTVVLESTSLQCPAVYFNKGLERRIRTVLEDLPRLPPPRRKEVFQELQAEVLIYPNSFTDRFVGDFMNASMHLPPEGDFYTDLQE